MADSGLTTQSRNPGHLHQNTALEKNIKNLFASSLTSPTQPNFTDEQGYLFELAEAPRYTQGLGKRILILDLETRPLKSIEDWARGGYDWAAVDHVSGGVFNHYTYCALSAELVAFSLTITSVDSRL